MNEVFVSLQKYVCDNMFPFNLNEKYAYLSFKLFFVSLYTNICKMGKHDRGHLLFASGMIPSNFLLWWCSSFFPVLSKRNERFL